jgi:hypothetical protein
MNKPNLVPTRTTGTLGEKRRSSGIHCLKKVNNVPYQTEIFF